jgi:hypothetical protein
LFDHASYRQHQPGDLAIKHKFESVYHLPFSIE